MEYLNAATALIWFLFYIVHKPFNKNNSKKYCSNPHSIHKHDKNNNQQNNELKFQQKCK